MSIEEGITIQKTEKKEESLEELIDYMFFKSGLHVSRQRFHRFFSLLLILQGFQ